MKTYPLLLLQYVNQELNNKGKVSLFEAPKSKKTLSRKNIKAYLARKTLISQIREQDYQDAIQTRKFNDQERKVIKNIHQSDENITKAEEILENVDQFVTRFSELDSFMHLKEINSEDLQYRFYGAARNLTEALILKELDEASENIKFLGLTVREIFDSKEFKESLENKIKIMREKLLLMNPDISRELGIHEQFPIREKLVEQFEGIIKDFELLEDEEGKPKKISAEKEPKKFAELIMHLFTGTTKEIAESFNEIVETVLNDIEENNLGIAKYIDGFLKDMFNLMKVPILEYKT